MSRKYRDREGSVIREGDAVATAVTINQQTYRPFSFVVAIVKRKAGRLILDGVFTEGWIGDRKPRELQKLHGSVDLRKLNADWILEFGER